MMRRLTGYSAGSVVAATLGELAFVLTYGWAHAGTTLASAAGFIAAAVPNYVLNRRWAWGDRRGRSRRAEATLYIAVAITSFVAAAYLGVSGIFFLVKFVLYERVVFVSGAGEPRAVQTTRS